MALAFLSVIFFGAIVNRKFLDAIFVLVTLGISLLVLDHAALFGTFRDTLYNIQYWIHNASEIWGTEISFKLAAIIFAPLIFLYCGLTIAVAFMERFYRDNNLVLIVLGVMLIQIFLLKTASNRLEVTRMIWCLWPSLLIMIHFASKMDPEKFGGSIKFPILSIPSIFSIPVRKYYLYFVIAFASVLAISPLFLYYGSFFKNIVKPRVDSAIVSSEVLLLSKKLLEFNDDCVLGWTNEGVVQLMTKKRFCTRFPSAIYVSKDEELEYLKQIERNAPVAIVFDVVGPSMMNVDNKSMASRLPNVYQFIKSGYPKTEQVGRYVIVSK